jgi:hypothetical protein
MISDEEYEHYRDNPLTTRKGRAWLAAFLIRNGRACTRAYDNCFEEGDGEQVLALLLREVRNDPDLRRMMEEQGAWSPRYEDTPEPEPLAVGEAERIAGFRRATCGMAGASTRWKELAAKGMSDAELAAALAYEIGNFGGSGGPDGLWLIYQAAASKSGSAGRFKTRTNSRRSCRARRPSPWRGASTGSGIRRISSRRCFDAC